MPRAGREARGRSQAALADFASLLQRIHSPGTLDPDGGDAGGGKRAKFGVPRAAGKARAPQDGELFYAGPPYHAEEAAMSTSSNAEDTSYQEFRDALDQLERVGQAGGARDITAPADVRGDPIKQFCGIWPTARQVIELILRIPFVPSAAKTVLRTLLGAGDALCRTS
jgi:hypothetical protein